MPRLTQERHQVVRMDRWRRLGCENIRRDEFAQAAENSFKHLSKRTSVARLKVKEGPGCSATKETPMRYAILIYENEADFSARTDEDSRQRYWASWREYSAALTAAGLTRNVQRYRREGQERLSA